MHNLMGLLYRFKVVTTIFHGKQKYLRNTVGQLFPKPMAKHFSEQMMAEAGLKERRRAIDLNMADFSSLCFSYQVGDIYPPSVEIFTFSELSMRIRPWENIATKVPRFRP